MAKKEASGAQRVRQKKPWLTTGMDLNERIARGMPEVMNIIDIDRTHLNHIEMFRLNLIKNIHDIVRGWGIDPSPRQQSKTLIDCAAKIREAGTVLASGLYSWGNGEILAGYLQDLDLLATEIEQAAARIGNKGGGASDAAREGNGRKRLSLIHARDLILEFGRCGPPAVTKNKPFLQLSALLFEIATGNRTGELKNIALKMFPGKKRKKETLG